MAKNRVREEANQVSLPVPAGTVSGDAVAVGKLNGVALTDRDAWTAGEATVQLDGSFKHYIDDADWVGGAIAVGDAVTHDQVNAKGDVEGARVFGHALTPLADGASGEVEVRTANPIA